MVSRRKHYWLLAVEPERNKPYLVYGGMTEQEARERGLEVLPGIDFEIRELPTRNLAAASAMVRGKRLDDTHSLKRASDRLGHDRSLDRLKRRLRGS